MRSHGVAAACLLCCLLARPVRAAEREDVLIADFEGKDYGAWKTTGEAFGPGPAHGTLPDQMPVSGYKGQGLVNSYFHGDKSVGTLISPDFKITRNYLNFLIGGGNHPDKTCLNFVVDGKVVRTATGPDNEQLQWRTFNLTALQDKTAHIEIIDDETGGWGHISVDQIVLSDERAETGPVGREIAVEKRYLNLPVKRGAAKRKMRYVLDDRTLREFEIELADGAADFWVFDDATDFRGKHLKIEVDGVPADFKGLEAITQADEIKGDDHYTEKHRPQFHFTSRRGWLNDPNGLVFSDGEYHLFYQHNPYGWDWGNMHWGHAVSADLVHWKELPTALYPRRFGDWCFSGSAVVDQADTSGFLTGDVKPLVAAYTSTGRGECIAYSNDRGRTWADYKNDPVVKHSGRDPRLFWHEPSKQWVMAVYDESAGKQWIAFHTSPDLKEWKFQSRIEGFFECPDLFELPVEDGDGAKKWVLYSGDARYMVGDFDGKTFTPDGQGKKQLWYGAFYAAQTYNNTPDGRRIQIGWGNGVAFPGMSFNQQMAFPCRLTLHKTADGVRLFGEPVKELETLHGKKHAVADRALKPGDNPLADVSGDQFDIRAEFEPGDGETFGFTIRGVPVVYDVKKQEISCKGVTAPLKPEDGKVRLQLLVDRGSIEIFGAGGRVALSIAIIPADDNHSLEVFSHGGAARLRSLEAYEMKSAWEAP